MKAGLNISIRDLAPEQWDEVGKFYENCTNFDEAWEAKEASFQANATELRASIHRIVGDYSKEIADTLKENPDNNQEIASENQQSIAKITAKKDVAVDANIRKLIEMYGPDKPYNDAAYYYNLLPRSLVNTPTGQRFTELADRRIIRKRKR